MWQRLFVGVTFSLATVGLWQSWPSVATSQARPETNTIETFSLRIESADLNQQTTVEGAVWVDGAEPVVRVVRQLTPVALTLTGNLVNGIFVAASGTQVRVRLVEASTGGDRFEAAGPSVVLARGLAPSADFGFIKVY